MFVWSTQGTFRFSESGDFRSLLIQRNGHCCISYNWSRDKEFIAQGKCWQGRMFYIIYYLTRNINRQYSPRCLMGVFFLHIGDRGYSEQTVEKHKRKEFEWNLDLKT